MATIINKLDRADARVSNWIDENYPTAPIRILVGTAYLLTAMGVFLVMLSHWSRTSYDVFAGLFITLVGAVTSTLLTLWAHNEIARMRDAGRRAHPSYPYKVKK